MIQVDGIQKDPAPIPVVVDASELAYLDGLSGNVQTQLDGKAASSHTHAASAITSGTLSTTNGGTGRDSSAIAKGGILAGSGTGAFGALAVGSDGQVLTADAASANGVKWAAAAGGVTKESDLPTYALPRHFGPGAIVKLIGSGVTLTSGNNDLGTPPTGKRWALISGVINFNSGGTVANAYMEFKRSGTYYRTMTTFSGAAPTSTTTPLLMPILEDTDTLAINVDGTGAVFIGVVVEYSAAASRLKSVVTLSLASGNNTIYGPVAANTYAILLGPGTLGSGLLTLQPSKEFITYVNTSGATRTFYFNAVPSGGSVIAPGAGSNALHSASSFTVANNLATTMSATILGGLGPGDFLNLNTNSANATQIAWVTVYEFAAST